MALLGDLLNVSDKPKTNYDQPRYFVDPYIEQLRGTFGERSNPSYYKFTQPGIETATENRLLSRLNSDPTELAKRFGPEAAAPYYNAAKERMQEGFNQENQFAKDIYQREGVLTSTPGMQGQIDLKRKQGQDLNEFSQKLMYEDIQRELDATKLAEDIMTNSISQGRLLGGTQREYQAKPYDYANQVLLASPQLKGDRVDPRYSKGKMGQLGDVYNANTDEANNAIAGILKLFGLG